MSNVKKHLGLRCSNNAFAFAVLSGTKEQPKLEQKNLVRFPKNYSRPQSLKWFYQEIQDLLKHHVVLSITIKGTETAAQKGASYTERVENEAIVFLVAAEHNLGANVLRKVKATLAKDLVGKGKAALLDTDLNTMCFPNFSEEDDKIKEAILAAWSSI